MDHFEHDKPDVYQLAIELATAIDTIVEQLPPAKRYQADLLKQASISIPLNIAQSTTVSNDDKAEHYYNAKHSATRCMVILDLLLRQKLVKENSFVSSRELLLKIVEKLDPS